MLSSNIALPALRLPLLHKRHWPSTLMLATAAFLWVVAGLSVTLLEPSRGAAYAKIRGGANGLVVPGLGTPPQPEPMRFRDVAPQDALAINAAVPVSTLPNPAARPFSATFASAADRLRALECLTAAVYYEAAIEPLEGQRAVAQVVLNRVRHPAYPKSICGVVFQGWERTTGCQFTFTCDGNIRRAPAAALWARARRIAEQALAGAVYAPVGWATHYHTNWVVPYWSSSLVKLANVGTHIFYRWEGGWGRSPAFRFGAAGTEPQMGLMRHLTSDPSSLADAEMPPPPPATLPGVELATPAAGAGQPVAGALNSDISNRAVIRRYEPMTREAATAAAIARTKEPASASLHWALSGLPSKTPAGGETKTDAQPAQPKCLEGVRKVTPEGQAQTQKC